MFFLRNWYSLTWSRNFPSFMTVEVKLLEHLIPGYTLTAYFTNISCNIVVPSRFIKCSASSNFSSKMLYPILVSYIDLGYFKSIKLFRLLKNVWIILICLILWGHAVVVGWGTMLQAGRSWVRFSVSLHFSVDPILPAALWPWGYPMWLWGHSLFKISSPGLVLYGTKWLLWRPHN
jgi:hypothetical protein